MSPKSDDEIDYLLSRGKLGGSQRQRILDKALAASRCPFWTRWGRHFAWGAGGLVLATGTAAFLLMFRAQGDGTTAAFRVKGPGDAPLITVSCLGAEVRACPRGSKVAFSLDGGHDQGGFLTAYADPTAGGERVWYLNNEPVAAPQGEATPRVIRKAALIGDGQPPGAYIVHAIFSRHPVAREALAGLTSADTLARVDVDLVVAP
jgi:hypothetical protein